MTYIRNPSGDLVYDQNTGTYSPAGYNVLSISRAAFLKRGYLDPKLTTVDMNDVPFTGNSMDGTFFSSGTSNLTTVTNINNNTTSMVDTFYNCRNFTGIDKFPDNVINIEGCFYRCRNLTDVPTIPNSVTDISYAFGGCNRLTYVPDMPNSVTRAVEAYYGADHFTTPPRLSNNLNPSYGLSRTFYFTGITDIPAIPNSITDLYMTFTQCSGLYDLSVTTNRLPDSITNMYLTFSACFSMVRPPILPNSVVSLYSTFAKCFNLTMAPVIPNTVKNMAGTFYQCYNLTVAPILPEGLETLGEGGHDLYPLHQYGAGCFSCTGIVTAPTIPSSVTNMSGCFGDCENLVNTSVIPQNVTDMGTCFINCSKVVNFPAIPFNVTNIADCFAGCTNLVNAPIIPRNVTKITGEFYDGLFARCTNLTGDIYIMSDKIGYANRTFYNTSLAKNVYIPFTKQDGTPTSTYDAFVAAGYDTQGTKEGVTLVDCGDKKIFSIYADEDTAIIDLENEGNEFSGKGSMSIIVNKNTDVSYVVYKEGLRFEEGTVTVSDDTVVGTSIVDEEKLFHITYDDENYTVITDDTTYLRVSNSTLESPNVANDFVITEEE